MTQNIQMTMDAQSMIFEPYKIICKVTTLSQIAFLAFNWHFLKLKRPLKISGSATGYPYKNIFHGYVHKAE